MKTVALWAFLFLAISSILVSAVRAPSPDAVAAQSASAAQLLVDGIPVCVFTHAGQSFGAVGRCGIEVPVPGMPPPAHGEDPSLPPGHPPVSPGPGEGAERGKGTLI